MTVDLLCRLRPGGAKDHSWARRTIAISRKARLTLITQILWVMRASFYMLRSARRYDIVHFQGAYWLNFVPSLFVPTSVMTVFLPVLERGDLHESRGVLGALRRRLQRIALRRAHRVFALSQGIESELLELGLTQSRIVRIGNPVDRDFAARRESRNAADVFSILFSGKLGPIKSPDKILDAVAGLVRRSVDARATFIGPFVDDAYAMEFRSKVESLGLNERVNILGFVRTPSQVFRQNFHAFVLASHAEGMPGAMAEAMYSSLPVVVTDVGAMGAVVRDSGAGFVIEDADGLFGALMTLASDDGLRLEMGDKAAVFAQQNFAPPAVARQYFLGVFEKDAYSSFQEDPR